MMKVTMMTRLMSIPISSEVSKSRDTARIAIPIFVWLISITSANTSAIVKIGVMTVTILVCAPSTVTVFCRNGMDG